MPLSYSPEQLGVKGYDPSETTPIKTYTPEELGIKGIKPQEPISGATAFTRAGIGSLLPGAGGLAGAEVLAPLGAELGTAIFPGVGTAIGGIGGGLLGALLGSTATEKVQEKALEKVPEFREKIGQSPEQLQQAQEEHPYASLAGSVAGNFATLRPNFSDFSSLGKFLGSTAPEEASSAAKILSTPAANAAIGATIAGGQEALNEQGDIDPYKVGISALGGALGTKKTGVGEAVSSVATPLGERIASPVSRLNDLRYGRGVAESDLAEKPDDTTHAPQTLLLPAPDKPFIDVQQKDPLLNPVGNFNANELSPEILKRFNDIRKEQGKSKLDNPSLEDLVDAGVHPDYVDKLLAFKNNYTSDIEAIKPEEVLNVAASKNVDTTTAGFTDFLRRATGSEDLNAMSQPQLHSALSALSAIPKSPELLILPQGTNATRFTQKQYDTALKGLGTVLDVNQTPFLGKTSVINEVKDFTGLTNDSDAKSLVDTAIRNGDLESKLVPRFEVVNDDGKVQFVTSTRQSAERAAQKTGLNVREGHNELVGFAGEATQLPGGPDIRVGTFKQGETPAGFQVKQGDRTYPSIHPTEESALAHVDRLTLANQQMASANQGQITKAQNQIEANKQTVAKVEAVATTQLQVDRINALKEAENKALQDKIDALAKQNEQLTQPLEIAPSGMKPVTRQGYTYFENEQPHMTFPSQIDAERYALSRLPEDTLNQIIASAPSQKGLMPKRLMAMAQEELRNRQGTGGIEVKTTNTPEQARANLEKLGIYTQDTKDKLESLRQSLLPTLNKLGLEKVGLRIVNSILDGRADGEYVKNLISIALDAKNPVGALRHEAVHALKELGAFTSQEWNVLTNKAKSDWIQTYLKDTGKYDKYKEQYKKQTGGLKGFDEMIQEEAIAEAFKHFDKKAPAGWVGNLFYRVREMFNRLKNVLNHNGFQTSDDIFNKIEEGQLKPTKEATQTVPKYRVNEVSRPELEPAKGVVAEVAPHPDQEITQKWRTMKDADKLETTEAVARRVVPSLLRDMGLNDWTYAISSGRFEGEQNPNLIIKASPHSTPEEVREFAKVIGHVLDQKAMVAFDESNTKSDSQAGFVSVKIPKEMTEAEVTKLREHIAKEVPQASGDTVRDGHIHYGNFSEYSDAPLTDEQYYNAIRDAIDKHDYDGNIDIYKPQRFHSEYIEPENRNAYLEDTRYGESNREGKTEGDDNIRREGRNRLQYLADQAIASRDKWINSTAVRPTEPIVRPSRGSNEGIVLGDKQENGQRFEGVHYGNEGVDVLKGDKYGNGLKGAERERVLESEDPRIKRRVYFYTPYPDGTMPLRESGLGGHVHSQTLDNILGPGKEMYRLNALAKGDANKFESAVVDAGYDGYAIPSSGMMVALNHDVPVKYHGKLGDVDVSKFSLRDDVAPEINEMADRITTVRKNEGFIDRILSAISPDFTARVRQGLIFKFDPIEKQSLKIAEEKGADSLLAHTSAIASVVQSMRGASIAAASFRDGIPVFRDGFTTIDPNTKGLIPILAPLTEAGKGDPYIYQLFQLYAGARRGSRLNAEGREQTFTPEDIKRGKALEDQFPVFKEVFDEYQKYNEGLVKYMKDTGVISAKDAEIWTKNWDYIPFYRQMDDEATAGPRIFGSIAGVAKPKKLEGGSYFAVLDANGKEVKKLFDKALAEKEASKIDGKVEQRGVPLADFLETVTRNARAAIESGLKNEAARRTIRDSLELGTAEEVKAGTSGSDIINIKENGETKYYRVADPLMTEALKGLNVPQMPLLATLAKPASFLRNMVTKDPGFILANLSRDSLAAYMTSGSDMKPIVDSFKQFGKILADKSPEARALMYAGLGGHEFSGDIRSSAEQVSKELRKRTGTRTGSEMALLPASKLWDMLEHASTSSELASRAEIYKRTLARTGSEAEAIYQAIELMNFDRKGSWQVARVVSALVPFLNARVQGLDLLYRAGYGKMATQNSEMMKKAFIARSTQLLGLSAMYWYMVHDDDSYKKLTQQERDNNWIIPGISINGKPFKFPIPFELGVLFKVLPERIAEYSFGNDTGKDFTRSMARQVSSTLSFNPIPQFALPLLENIANYSFFTGQNIVGRGMQDVAPEYQFNEGTSQFAKILGQQLGYSPMKIDHLIQGYTGVMGLYTTQMLDSALTTQGEPVRATKRFEQLPVVKRFFANDTGTVENYYDLKKEVDEVVRTLDLLKKNPDEMMKYFEEHQDAYALRHYITKQEKTMKQLRQYRLMVDNDKTMSPEEKRKQLDFVHDTEIEITKDVQSLRKQFMK